MGTAIQKLPLFVILMGFGALAMLVPASHALVVHDYNTMRIFFYGTILFSLLTLIIGLATAGYEPKSVARSQLVALLAAFSCLPLMFAIPLRHLACWFRGPSLGRARHRAPASARNVLAGFCLALWPLWPPPARTTPSPP